MASKRTRYLKDGTPYWQIRYRIDGEWACLSIREEAAADAFKELIERIGPVRALEIQKIERPQKVGVTVGAWVKHHIDHLSGVERRTRHEYLGILAKDIEPVLGPIPLKVLSRDDITEWLEGMREAGSAGKTIAKKHVILSAALNRAVEDGHIAANPAARMRLPRTERRQQRHLTTEEFDRLLTEVVEPWRPFVRFLVASGCRLQEATALRPSDVDRANNTVLINRAWKRGSPGGYYVGTPKTSRSHRTIDVDATVLSKLDYSHEWLFVNPTHGGPVRPPNFRANVWRPAIDRAKLAAPRPRIHDLRHTCASWLIQDGHPLPVVQQHLGHESIEVTISVYGHLDRRNFRDAAATIGNRLTPKASSGPAPMEDSPES